MTQEELSELLEKKDFKSIRASLEEMNPVDIASLLEDLPDNELAVTFRLIEKSVAAETFSYMDADQQQLLLTIFTNKEIKEVLDDMFTDDTVDLLEDMPANVVSRILANLDKDDRKAVNEILRYPEDSDLSLDEFLNVESLLALAVRVCGPGADPRKADRLLSNYQLIRPETIGADGHLMQIGTPRDIYAKPQNPFVAGFIGVSNFLDCEVNAPAPGNAAVSIKGELDITVPVSRAYTGSGKISARPEQLFFSESGMPGTILFSTFLGDFIEYEVQLNDGQNLIVNEYTKDTTEIHSDGEQVHLSFDPMRISLYDKSEEVLSL